MNFINFVHQPGVVARLFFYPLLAAALLTLGPAWGKSSPLYLCLALSWIMFAILRDEELLAWKKAGTDINTASYIEDWRACGQAMAILIPLGLSPLLVHQGKIDIESALTFWTWLVIGFVFYLFSLWKLSGIEQAFQRKPPATCTCRC